MRLAVGADLGRQLDESGPLPPWRAVEIIRQVADALDSAHEDGLVHRDVKPSNVVITSDRNRDFAYLVDFGIVRAMASSTRSSLTAAGSAVGTVAYMAPELFTSGQVDRRVDIYALGCLFYEALTGQPPFTGEGPALMYQHLIHRATPAVGAPHGATPQASTPSSAAPWPRTPASGYARLGNSLMRRSRPCPRAPYAAPCHRDSLNTTRSPGRRPGSRSFRPTQTLRAAVMQLVPGPRAPATAGAGDCREELGHPPGPPRTLQPRGPDRHAPALTSSRDAGS
jgi:serine/threonine protein kinase